MPKHNASNERVKRDFRAGVRGGIVTTPTAFELRDEVPVAVSRQQLLADVEL